MAETEEERRARIDRVLRGEETVTPKIEQVVPTYFFDDEGKTISATELARSNDYVGRKPAAETDPVIPQSLMDTMEMQAKSLPILRNMLGTNEKDEARAYEVGKKLGLSPQALLDNAELDREATLAYEGQRNRDFLQGKPFTPKTLKELYPEVDVDDPVAASMALRDFNDLRETRNIVQTRDVATGLWDVFRKDGMRRTDEDSLKAADFTAGGTNSIMDSWNAGTRDVEASRIMEAHMKGDIGDEEAKARIEELYAGEQEYQRKKQGLFNLVVDDTVRNVSNMAQITMGGMRDIVEALGPQAAPMIRQLAQVAGVATAGLAATGVGTAPMAVGSAVAGITIGTASLFLGSFRQMRAQNYWDMMQKRSPAGSPLYTKAEAAKRASVQAFWQAGLETVGAEVVIGRPMAKVFGGDVSKAIIQNAAARSALATAGRNAIRKETAKAAAKQFAKGAAFEISEEGMQQVVADADETIFGNDPKTMSEIFWNGVEAMAEAAPAVVGMTLPGVALHGAGTYRGYRSLQKLQMTDAVEEYKRETEKDMVSALLEQRDKNNLYKKSPEVYGKTIQAQMERSGKETLYIDAASVAETEEGRAALSELAEKNIVSAEDVQNAVANGTPLEVRPGVYMQEVTQETADIISDNATFDKGGRTLAAIQKAREHYKNVMAKWEEAAAEREAAAVDAFIDEILPSRQKGEDFLAGSDIEEEQIALREKERAILKEILAEDIANPLDALKRAEEKAREEFYDVTGTAEEKANYIRHHGGTVEIIQDFRVQQYQNVKVSSNDGWYSKLYKKLGKKPTIRDAEDAAYDEAYQQADAAGDTEWKAALKAAKERRDVLYSLRGVIESIDTQDLAARASLSQEAYHQIYAPVTDTLKGANPEVAKAAKDSALLLARQADIFHAVYGTPYEDAVRVILGDRAETGAGVYGMPVTEALDLNVQYEPVNLDALEDKIKASGETEADIQKVEAFIREELKGTVVPSADRKILLDLVGIGDGVNQNHVIKAHSQHGKLKRNKETREIRNIALSNLYDVFSHSMLVEYKPGSPNKTGYYAHTEHNEKVTAAVRLIVPVTFKREPYTLVVTAECFEDKIVFSDMPVTLYEVYPRKKNGTRPNITYSASDAVYGNSILDWLANVKDLNGDPYVVDGKLNTKLREEEQAQEKNLVVYHNVSIEKLNDAIQLGGLPMPSLAVTKKDIPFDNFGEITLIGNRDMIDPQKSKDNDVFSRDGYTVRRPGIGYEPASSKKEEAFHKKYEAVASELKEKGIAVYEIDFSAYTGENAIRRIARDEAVQYFYIKNVLGQDVSINRMTVTPNVPNKSFFETYPNIREALKDSKVADGDFSDLDKACRPYFAKLEEQIKNKEGLMAPVKRRLDEMQRDGHITSAGVDLLTKWLHEYEEGLKKKSYETVDVYAFQNAMDDIIQKAGRDKFDAYVRQEWEGLDQKKYLWDNGKKYKFTADNIVKIMRRYRGTNNEGSGGVGYGFNSLLAFLSKKFSTIDEIKKSETSLAPNKKESAQYEKAETMYTDLLEEAINLRPDEYEETVEDDLAKLLRDTLDGKKKNHGFPKNETFRKHIEEFLEEVDKVTTDYFEAKPARNVAFSEFSGAVVPKGTPKETIDFLKNQGLDVIEYEQDTDGDRETKIEELATKKDVYFQKQNTRYAGQYSEAENLIRVFSAGNASTVMHESAHAWLSMLERLVKDEADKRGMTGTTDEILAALSSDPSVNANMIRDLSTIRAWAKYSPEALSEYKGTTLEKEFAKHAEDIAKGIGGAEERFIQERFARAFERYLMTGKAPTKDLRTPFRHFKAWLTEIYKTVKNLGQVDPPKDVARIFDQMLATKEEIDAWAAEKKLTSRNLPLDYSATEKENIERWQEEIREKAKEKCMAAYLVKVTGDLVKNFEESLDTLRNEFRKQLAAENPIYQIETMRKLHPTAKDWQSFLQEQGYTPETYEAAIEKAGGHLEQRIEQMIEEARKQYNDNIMTPENIRAMAEAELAAPEGMQELVEIETNMMNDRLAQYIRTAAASLIEIRNTEDISHIAYEIKKRNGLATAEDEKAYQAEREKEKHAAEKGALKEKIQNAEAEKAKLRGELKARMESLRTARDILNWKTRDIRQKAESTLAKEDVSKATNWKWWDNKGKSAALRVADAIKRGDWLTAAAEKRNEAYFSMMSRVAHENEAKMKKILRGDPKTADPNDKDGMAKYGVLGILNRIGRKEKPVLMQEQARYFCQHFAYQMGLVGKDGVLPVNENGNVVDFSWVALARELNPTQAMTAEAAGGIYDGADVIAPWIKTIFDGKEKTLVGTMSFEHFLDAMDAIRAAYKIGRREYEGNTLRLDGKPISFEEAAKKLITSKWTGKIEIPYFAKQRETGLSRTAKKLKHAVTELALPEILWERLGDAWYELFYQTVDRAANTERVMLEEASATINQTVNHYSRKEWQTIRNDKKYRLGTDETGKPVYYTKETVLVAALNWGSGANRARITETLRVTREETEDFIFRNMTDKDWDFVEAVWAHINSYYPARNAVQDHLYGVPLGKVKAYTFTLPSGREIKGDYYPIKYDAETASVSAERSVNEIIQQGMMGVSTFGLGMGSTKQRTFMSGGQNLRLDLEVYLDHVAEAVHHIAMREATVDVYKLISRQDVTDNIIERVGIDTYNTLKQWAADQWHSPIDRMTNFEKLLTRLRRHMTFAAMAYRASTAILNAANIFPVMEKMGAANALYALGDYYTGDVRKKRAFVMEKSSFMRGRQTNMERDFARERKLPVGQHTIKGVAMAKGALEEVNTFGYWAIVETDFMLSLPQWLSTYKKVRQELSVKKMTAEEIDAEAVRRADKAVRETFGSGEIKDQSAVMKSKFLGQITPFYSYTALVMNQFIRAGYQFADTGNVQKVIKTVFYWWVLNAVAESALRQMMAAASGDDREDYWQRLIYSFSGAGPVGGVPIARDIVPWMAAKAMGLYKGDGKSEISALSVADDAMKVWSDLMANDVNWLNVGRDATRVGNRIVGASDTLTDGFWSLLKLLTTDTDKTAMEIIASFILDKDIEKKGGRK